MWAVRIAVVLNALVATSLSAQIYEWRDASGSRNFTNDIEDVPEVQREEVRVVVRASRVSAPELQTGDSDESTQVPPLEARAVRPDRERRRAEMAEWRAEREQRRLERESPKGAQVVYDNSFRFSRPEPAPAPQVNVNIAGPLAVSQVVVAESQLQPYAVDPGYGIGYEPVVSTSFDLGRFRHRTVRMRLQDRFQYDRNERSVLVGDLIPLGYRFGAKRPGGVRSCSSSGPRRRSVLRR